MVDLRNHFIKLRQHQSFFVFFLKIGINQLHQSPTVMPVCNPKQWNSVWLQLRQLRESSKVS